MRLSLCFSQDELTCNYPKDESPSSLRGKNLKSVYDDLPADALQSSNNCNQGVFSAYLMDVRQLYKVSLQTSCLSGTAYKKNVCREGGNGAKIGCLR